MEKQFYKGKAEGIYGDINFSTFLRKFEGTILIGGSSDEDPRWISNSYHLDKVTIHYLQLAEISRGIRDWSQPVKVTLYGDQEDIDRVEARLNLGIEKLAEAETKKKELVVQQQVLEELVL